MPIIYESRPDPLNRRRLSRARFAWHSLPVLLGSWLMFGLQSGLMQLMADNTHSLGRAIVAMVLLAIVNYGMVAYLHRQLVLRCNDANPRWAVEDWLFWVARIGAVAGGWLPLQAAPLVAVVLLQFACGMLLPANQSANLSGAAEADSGAVRCAAVFACVLAGGLLWVLFR